MHTFLFLVNHILFITCSVGRLLSYLIIYSLIFTYQILDTSQQRSNLCIYYVCYVSHNDHFRYIV